MFCQGNCFVIGVKLNFCWWETHCIDNQDKFQSVRDTDSEFTQCQTSRKKLQSVGISSVSLHAFMKTLKSNISETYKVQVDCFKNSESDSYDKNDMNEKVNDLVRLHEAMQKKIENSIIFRTNPNSYLGLECTVEILMSLNTLFELHMKSKK